MTSTPAGINCGTSCSASFTHGASVQLAAAASAGSTFAGWSGACTGTSACSITLNGAASVTALFNVTKVQDIQALNHIIFMAQENRGFDHYFGALGLYRAAHGFGAATDIDGLTFDAQGVATNSNPNFDRTGTVSAVHLITGCVENPSPSWEESHVDFNRSNPMSTTAALDGFVFTAATFARNNGLHDIDGQRAMGYYTEADLPYYYFMASNFGTSDRWFAPVMSRTHPNRMYLMAGTSQGHVYPIPPGGAQLTAKTIFQLLDENHISWKIYVTDQLPGLTLTQSSYISMFTYSNQNLPNVVPISEYLTDVANGTLPQVAMIEGGYNSGRDEHPDVDPNFPGAPVQKGAAYVASLINALMSSKSWNDSALVLTYDEFGGFYEHVPPQPAVSPDGIAPQDFTTTDSQKFNDDFTRTGYRVPLIVVSPFSKKNFVSHTARDYTAILKLIETRFKLPNLTARDAAQDDMTEFFDFANAPWATPPAPPAQPAATACYTDHLP
ncbi:MAG: Phospholipase [Candidatus Angelobacter sp.]|nr:Phospholipase [Candidatus Angelobacter sp.]